MVALVGKQVWIEIAVFRVFARVLLLVDLIARQVMIVRMAVSLIDPGSSFLFLIGSIQAFDFTDRFSILTR